MDLQQRLKGAMPKPAANPNRLTLVASGFALLAAVRHTRVPTGRVGLLWNRALSVAPIPMLAGVAAVQGRCLGDVGSSGGNPGAVGGRCN